MQKDRPDLSRVDPDVLEYILALEAELENLKTQPRGDLRSDEEPVTIEETVEPPTTIQVITGTADGILKRTARHHYTRQNRGGMGVFDIETPHNKPPALLAIADIDQTLLLLTDRARGFRLPVTTIPGQDVRDRGKNVLGRTDLQEGELIVKVLPVQAEGYLALLSKNGDIRLLRHHLFGNHMKPGVSLYDLRAFGELVDACWTPGDGDLFIATRQGKGIRFFEKLAPVQGGRGIRLQDGDEAVGIAAVYLHDGVFLLSKDGKATIRLMSGFSANKSPGGGGKIAMNTDALVGVAIAEPGDDIFIITETSKIIRFPAEQVPPKEGVVQGVIAVNLRNDRPTAVTVSQNSITL